MEVIIFWTGVLLFCIFWFHWAVVISPPATDHVEKIIDSLHEAYLRALQKEEKRRNHE